MNLKKLILRIASPCAIFAGLAIAALLWASQESTEGEPVAALRTTRQPLKDSARAVSLDFARGGERLIALGSDGEVRAWETESGKGRRVFPETSDFVKCTSLFANLAAHAAVNDVVYDTLCDLEKDERIPGPRELGHSSTDKVAKSGTRLALGGRDGAIRLWDRSGAGGKMVLRHHGSPVHDLHFSQDGSALASAHHDGTVEIWDLQSGRPRAVFSKRILRPSTGAPVMLSPAGRTFASTSAFENTVEVWDLETGRAVLNLRGHSRPVCSLAYHPSGRILASGDREGVVKLWDAAAGEELASLKADNSAIWSLAFSPDGTQLATAGWEKGVSLWRVERVLASRRHRPRTPAVGAAIGEDRDD